MKFLCLGYYEPEKFDRLPPAERQALVTKCKVHDEALRNSGHLLSVASLQLPPATRSIRPRDGKPVVTDGPFTESREVIGAFFLIEAADADEAVRIASLHPAAHLGEQVGWGIEVRPINYYHAP